MAKGSERYRAVNWGTARKPHFWVVEVNPLDGSYYPLSQHLSQRTADQEAKRLAQEWDKAMEAAISSPRS